MAIDFTLTPELEGFDGADRIRKLLEMRKAAFKEGSARRAMGKLPI